MDAINNLPAGRLGMYNESLLIYNDVENKGGYFYSINTNVTGNYFMIDTEALITAARRYLQDNHSYWADRYSK